MGFILEYYLDNMRFMSILFNFMFRHEGTAYIHASEVIAVGMGGAFKTGFKEDTVYKEDAVYL